MASARRQAREGSPIATATVPTIRPPAEGDSGIGERIGKYYVVHEVGRGSSGTVYLSHDPFYGRDVAIKLYHASTGDDVESRNARRMFLGEAQMIGKLQHPNIVPIYDAGEEDGRRYIVTDHVHGARTLSAYCRAGSLLPIDNVVSIVYKCAKALHYAHSRGVVHRDIKPSNILLTQDGDVRLVDFGIAIVTDSDVSRLEGVAGSPAYMSPEQVQGRRDRPTLGSVLARRRDVRDAERAQAVPLPARSASCSSRSSATSRNRCAASGAEIPEELDALVSRNGSRRTRQALPQRHGAGSRPHARSTRSCARSSRSSTSRSASPCCGA